MPLCKITLSYDGTGLSGWQIQPGRRTVQGLLAQALEAVTGETVLPQGSGRTDAGVHALGQVASVRLTSAIPVERLQQALNRRLPAAVRVLRLESVAEPFHARHSARQKTYLYRVLPEAVLLEPTLAQQDGARRERICPPFLAPFVWAYPRPLWLEGLQEAATAVLGTHNFSSFAAKPRPERVEAALYAPAERLPEYPEGPVSAERTIYESSWSVEEQAISPVGGAPVSLLVYRVTGSGFLHHMVRNLVGTFVLVGSGRMRAGRIRDILEAGDRAQAGPTAPARGLFLAEVQYA